MFTTLIPLALAAAMGPDGTTTTAEDAAPVEAAAPAPDAETPVLPVPLAEDEVLNEWTGALAGGVFLSYGNTERTTANLIFDAKYRRPEDRFTMGAWWYYGRETVVDPVTLAESKQTTDDRYGARFQYDYFLSEKNYLLAMVLGEHDENASIDLRLTGGVGFGRQFVDEEHLKYKAEVGVNYFVEEYIPEGSDDRLTSRLASDITWKPGEAWTFGNLLETYVPLESGSNWYTRSDTRLRYDVSAVIFAQVQWLLDYNTEPAPGAKDADNRVSISVGWTF